MNKEYEKLLKILKSNDVVKKSIEELRLWCVLRSSEWDDIYISSLNWIIYWKNREYHNLKEVEIIWLATDRHLRMFFDLSDWDFLKQNPNWWFEWVPQWEWEYSDYLFEIDNNYELSEQKEETLKKLNNWLENQYF